MDPCLHDGRALAEHFLWRAAQIHRSLEGSGGKLQVRWYSGRLLTYPYPASRGYGVHGALVAVYSAPVSLEWIEEDLLAFAVSLSDTCASMRL